VRPSCPVPPPHARDALNAGYVYPSAAAAMRAQLLVLAGVPMIIGLKKTGRFFFQRRKVRGTACFLGGVLLVFWGRTFFGIIVEGFGFLNLFGDFFPVVLAFLRNMPVIGNFLQLPFVRSVTDRLVTKSRLPV